MNELRIERFPQLSYAGTEAINTLCTNLSFTGEQIIKIMITSSHASEGKSFVSMNVMRTMAELGKSVVLVDADLRRSTIIPKYKIRFSDKAKSKGLSHMLAGMAKNDEIVYSTNIPNAFMVPIGKEVSHSLQLLNSPRFPLMLNWLAENFDYVFVDAPPIGAIIDAAEIAKSCDGTLIIVSYNAVRRRELLEAKLQIEQTGCPILGTVINMMDYDSYLSRNYYSKYYRTRHDQYY